ncbi:ataxin-10, partial [Musca vetustissima]|uniref:ataxin-10 n=1 Tax=Musca vetustissima TaxID=27455 RepID=UPI002AB77C99
FLYYSDLEKEVTLYINKLLCLQQQDCKNNHAELVENLRYLRNLCARGPSVQCSIATNQYLQEFLHNLLFNTEYYGDEDLHKQVRTITWQLMANVIVNNEETQSLVWHYHGAAILQMCCNLQKLLDRNVDISLMIVYNVMKCKGETVLPYPHVLKAVANVWRKILEQKCPLQFEFLHFIFEEFLVKDGRSCVRSYAQLETEEKLALLDYLLNYLSNDSPNGQVHTFLLQHISKEFKMKSDCILRLSSLKEVDRMKPREAYALLQCIASASGSEGYSQIYATDHALFLNVSSLLRCLVQVGKEMEKNIFTPMNKLEEVALSSGISADFQTEISYELKTLLVRSVANLLYKNSTNKGYCLDTQLMPALFECTNMDARNPLMKEWSILAIRNACEGCPEIQQVIANLTSQGPAQNDILNELNLDMGSLRISPGK